MDSWRRCTVGDLCDTGLVELQTGPFGSQLHSYDYIEDGIAVVPTEAIRDRKIDHSVMPRISLEKAEELKRHRLLNGDILFARRGVQATGRAAYVRKEEEGFICGTGAIRLRVQSENMQVSSEFLSHVFANRSSMEWFKFHAIGATMPNLNEGIIKRFPLSIPALREQDKISSLLSALEDKIELNQRMNETLEAVARAIFKDWFVDFGPTRAKAEGREPYLAPEVWGLFPDALDDTDVPTGWRLGTVGDYFHLTMGQSPPGNTYNDDGEGLPFFQGRTDFGFRYPENRKFCSAPSRIAEQDDTLVSVRAPVGDINMAWEKCCAGRGIAALRHKSGSRSFTYYSAWAIQQELKQYEHTGTVFGAINKKQFEALTVVEPTAEIVSLFENDVGALDERIRENVSESRTLISTRDLLLPKLMSGEIRLAEAEKVVEAVA